jgi:hypothetical protein
MGLLYLYLTHITQGLYFVVFPSLTALAYKKPPFAGINCNAEDVPTIRDILDVNTVLSFLSESNRLYSI